ncbi:uncharacterized protein LOC125950705 [Anopheles darlingi]|uniref:uncharacterized protein LOC125950705 n=1 Tax=Anopheles darlingi TaxID=43151 RepID=UPI0021001F3E|nr:uncharacterized protein LOC125950705 [Anopheles darlingi]
MTSSAVGSAGERSENAAARKRQNRQAVLAMLKKTDIKNKGLKRFFFFTYESLEPAAIKQENVRKTYYINGEMCEGDENYLRHMKKSLFVSNLPGGTKKSEIFQLFQPYGTVLAITLRTRSGRTIIGSSHQQSLQNPYDPAGPCCCCTIEFDSAESAENACDVKPGNSEYIAKPLIDPARYGTEHCVFVENIPPSRTRQDVWQHFKSFGPIRSLRMELPDGTLLLSDAEYGQLSSVNCHVRFRRRAEALAVTKALNRSSFKDRPISVQMAYQKYCNPEELSNNALRIFFQPFGDVVALDQIPHQRAGYVCFKPPLPVDIIKRIGQQVFRQRRILCEKLDIPGATKDGKLIKSGSTGSNGKNRASATTASATAGGASGGSSTSRGGSGNSKASVAKIARKIPRKPLPVVGRKQVGKPKPTLADTTKGGDTSKTTARTSEGAKENRAAHQTP